MLLSCHIVQDLESHGRRCGKTMGCAASLGGGLKLPCHMDTLLIAGRGICFGEKPCRLANMAMNDTVYSVLWTRSGEVWHELYAMLVQQVTGRSDMISSEICNLHCNLQLTMVRMLCRSKLVGDKAGRRRQLCRVVLFAARCFQTPKTMPDLSLREQPKG